MNSLRRKLLGAALIFGCMLSATSYGAILYEQKTEEPITKGATLVKQKLLMSAGWRNVNYIKVALDEENVSLRPLESASGVERKTILDMVKDTGAVAGVNADYFDMATNNTPSFGMVISDGTIRHAYNSNYSALGMNKNMATFVLDAHNTPSMEYYGISIRINSAGTFIGAASSYNNIGGTLTRPVILDHTYYATTQPVINKIKGVYTIVVENGQVTYQSAQDEVVNIPQMGFVILLPTSSANEYYSKLPLGSSVELSETLYLQNGVAKAVEEMQFGIGGGGLIMKNGAEYTGSAHKITPNAQDPRTVVATLKNSNTVLLMTIDGRNTYRGMTHSELVEFLKSYGVKDAMYLDGGGSTTLVSRNQGNSEVKVQNKPSGGSQRKVVNGIGVYTDSEKGPLAQLLLTANRDRTIVGESITFNLKGMDENDNPAAVNKANTIFTVSGIQGTFNGYTFTPTSAGTGIVVAQCQGVTAKKTIHVSDKAIGIRVEPATLQLEANSSKKVQVYAIDPQGYKIPLKSADISWSSSSNAVSVKDNTVLSGGKAIAQLTAQYKGLKAPLGVIVGKSAVSLDSFENNSAKWGGNTTDVTGKVENSKDTKYEGANAIKMAYTFKPSQNKQTAYAIFNKPISIPSDAKSINLWLNARAQGHGARLEIVDADGKKYYPLVSESLNFTGWKYFSINLPQEIKLPAKMTKFYTYASGVGKKISTAVYVDHVSATRGFKAGSGYNAINDGRFDPLYREDMQPPSGGQYLINVIGGANGVVLNAKQKTKLAAQMSKNAAAVIQAFGDKAGLQYSTTKLTYTNGYKSANYNNAKIILAGTDSGGLRAGHPENWLSLKKDIESTSAKNIILVMSKNPLTQFTDSMEGSALHEYLTTQKGKNIFVITSGGNENEVRIEDGIRYIRVSDLNQTNVTGSTFLKIKVVGDEIYYTFEKFNA